MLFGVNEQLEKCFVLLRICGKVNTRSYPNMNWLWVNRKYKQGNAYTPLTYIHTLPPSKPVGTDVRPPVPLTDSMVTRKSETNSLFR